MSEIFFKEEPETPYASHQYECWKWGTCSHVRAAQIMVKTEEIINTTKPNVIEQ